ncbi:MAG: cupin domain-containing protein [Alphaproteobacteria bacterium]|nr:cupin domain-containing protein [Alphaproteobacteria bacterium]
MSVTEQQDQRRTYTLAHATPETVKASPGRREFFNYLDLGVADASDGQMKAQIIAATQGLSEPTGWHYHECDSQFVYVLKGWVDLEFETGEKIRVKEGHSLFIPGGMRHNETATADELKILEVCTPADMGTVPCDPPA